MDNHYTSSPSFWSCSYWQNGPDSAVHTYLDLHEIRERSLGAVPKPEPDPLPSPFRETGDGIGAAGTLVVWSHLDRCVWKSAATIIENSELVIGRTYRRQLADGRVRIRFVALNADAPLAPLRDTDAKPNDPGYLIARTSCPPPFHETAMFQPWPEIADAHEQVFQIKFRGHTHPVRVRFSLAKEEARATNNAGNLPHGRHAARNVGVSIVRADRELDLDQNYVIQYDPRERWWGIEVDFPPALDDLFGVTNNKQSARTFADLARTDVESFLTNGATLSDVQAQMWMDDDPRGPLLDLALKIQTQIKALRQHLKDQTEGLRSGRAQSPAGGDDANDPLRDTAAETTATARTRERQQKGHGGQSDEDEILPPETRKQAIEQTLIAGGAMKTVAAELSARTVNDGLKYLFNRAETDADAFFSVKSVGGALLITLNTAHPAYENLVEVLGRKDISGDADDAAVLAARLTRAADGLKLLLSAWARYEDELAKSGGPRHRAVSGRPQRLGPRRSRLSRHRRISRLAGLPARLPRLRLHLELGARAKKANIKLQKEVRLAEQERNIIPLRPGKGQANRRERSNGRRNHDAPRGHTRQIPGQNEGYPLFLPHQSELFAERTRQHVGRCPRVQQAGSRNHAPVVRQHQRQKRHQASSRLRGVGVRERKTRRFACLAHAAGAGDAASPCSRRS